MGDASYAQTSFLGGEVSAFAQGRFDVPAVYRISMNVCLNALPLEQGACARRPGTQFAGTTRGGAAGRVISFDFQQNAPYTLEFTDNWLRFRSGATLVTTNDAVAVSSITTDNPVKINTAAAHGWSTGNSVLLRDIGINNPLLQNRVFAMTKTGSTQFTLADGITGAGIDGATLGTFVSGTVARVTEIATNYGAGSWSSIRSVQAETETVLLNGALPQVLSVVTPPTPIANATFSLVPANFLDGPYLDPFPGSQCTYDAQSGNITLTFSFQAYSATTSYNTGDFVTRSGQGYQSLTAANAGNQPDTHPLNWKRVNGGAPVGPAGFVGSDAGRHIRLFSEPAPYANGTYATGAVVKYNGAYWQSTANSNTAAPGTDATKWTPVTGASYAVWTWGRVLSVSGTGMVSPNVAIGNMVDGGGLAGAFDGIASKNLSASAQYNASATVYPDFVANSGYGAGVGVYYLGNLYASSSALPVWQSNVLYHFGDIVLYSNAYYQARTTVSATAPAGSPALWLGLGSALPTNTSAWSLQGAEASVSVAAFAGQDFHTAAVEISYATVFPSSDSGFGLNIPAGGLTFNLRGSQSAPATSSDGTLLGTTGAISDPHAAITITSSDQSTAWKYIWVEGTAAQSPPLADDGSHTFTLSIAFGQVEFFTPNVNNGSVVKVQLAGPALLYPPGAVITTWRAGAYSDTTGWPKNGTYHEGRLWLSGVVGNRIDSSNSNDLFNFAPTAPDGAVADSAAISYPFNARDVNAIFWMESDAAGIICGTQAGEWLVQASALNNILTPTSIQAHRVTRNGCANVEPRRTGLTIVFVQRYTRKLMEYFADVYSGKFTSPNLSANAKHLTQSGIAELAYQQELTPVVWARCGDGSLIGTTYKREVLNSSQGPTFNGWHRHVLGSGRKVESIVGGPSVDGSTDSITMVTNDPQTGVRHVEVLTSLFDEGAAQTSAWFLDDAVSASSYSVAGGNVTVNGLWHLNGKTVTVFAGGLDRGDFAVSNGSVTLPLDPDNGTFTSAYVATFLGAMPIVAGFTYTTQGQILRPATPQESGARNGPALGKKRRNHQIAALLKDTGTQATGGAAAVKFGTTFATVRPATLTTDGGTPLGPLTMFSGIYQNTVVDDYSYDGMLCWQVTRPLPCTVVSLQGFIQTFDR